VEGIGDIKGGKGIDGENIVKHHENILFISNYVERLYDLAGE
jgi:hypothetical protein